MSPASHALLLPLKVLSTSRSTGGPELFLAFEAAHCCLALPSSTLEVFSLCLHHSNSRVVRKALTTIRATSMARTLGYSAAFAVLFLPTRVSCL